MKSYFPPFCFAYVLSIDLYYLIKPLKICFLFENLTNSSFWYNQPFNISNEIIYQYLIFNSISLRIDINDKRFFIYDYQFLLCVLDVHEFGLLLFIVIIIITCNTMHIICKCKPPFAQYENNIKNLKYFAWKNLTW